MPRFLAAAHAIDGRPRALALVEQMESSSGPTYTVRELRRLGDDPYAEINRLMASEPQYVGATQLVVSGGQEVADALHAQGPSAAVVSLEGGESTLDAAAASAQVLVDTFEWLYRDGAVTVSGDLEHGSAAVDAMYRETDLTNAAADSDRGPDDNLLGGSVETLDGVSYRGDGAAAAEIEQSGSEANASTERIERPITTAEASAAAADAETRVGRIAARRADATPSLGDAEDVALALALAVWFGESLRDSLAVTDQADEIPMSRRRV